jgi:hypothetical protein
LSQLIKCHFQPRDHLNGELNPIFGEVSLDIKTPSPLIDKGDLCDAGKQFALLHGGNFCFYNIFFFDTYSPFWKKY